MAKKKTARPKAKVARKRAVRPSEKLVINRQVLDGLATILREARTRQSRKVCVA
jgi:hypothetical protein